MRALNRYTFFWVVAFLTVGFAGGSASATDLVEVECRAVFSPPSSGVCETTYQVPHFDGEDQVEDYAAVLDSVAAKAWQVEASVWDATGTHYLTWSCDADLSLAGMGVGAGCGLSRPAFYNRLGEYYKADASGPQRLRVEAVSEACAESVIGCAFEARLSLRLHG